MPPPCSVLDLNSLKINVQNVVVFEIECANCLNLTDVGDAFFVTAAKDHGKDVANKVKEMVEKNGINPKSLYAPFASQPAGAQKKLTVEKWVHDEYSVRLHTDGTSSLIHANRNGVGLIHLKAVDETVAATPGAAKGSRAGSSPVRC